MMKSKSETQDILAMRERGGKKVPFGCQFEQGVTIPSSKSTSRSSSPNTPSVPSIASSVYASNSAKWLIITCSVWWHQHSTSTLCRCINSGTLAAARREHIVHNKHTVRQVRHQKSARAYTSVDISLAVWERDVSESPKHPQHMTTSLLSNLV